VLSQLIPRGLKMARDLCVYYMVGLHTEHLVVSEIWLHMRWLFFYLTVQ